ncbi:hypothetical protein P691DRAFT_672705 [Macrolepiota fuliginosa MF-IS2]|uniref:Uncharacterized protein n=1 Tax=Macrolepiota fuliginosa MF-IS2 TaxID=1400762 RepID=A0A9P6C0P8_9AGAR|nr:hypothetical protein P691DRAFT_672705 [Macrolepiota fuliginosa MF-IS2]
MTLRRSEELDEEINSTKSAVDSTRTSVDVPALGSADQEAPNAGTVGSAVTLTDTQKAETPWDPFNNIPGLWLLKDGSIEPDVLEQSLEVTRDIALKWDLPLLKDIEEPAPKEPGSHLKLKQNFLPKASWKLKCVPIEHVDVVRQTLNNPTTAKDLLHELSRLQSRWPTEGKLIIEVNPDHVLGKTFYAKHLDSVIPFVELKYYLHEGLNLIRIIQLGDMSKHVFILYAIPPSEPPMTNGALPQHGQELDYELSLDSLQCILQKSKASNGATSTTPLFKARSAKARISPTGDRAGGSDSK